MSDSEKRSRALERLCHGLEPAQKAVLEHDFDTGPLLVLAGAGTGKTTTLTRRLALELADGTPASEILALTFTRKAAQEMRERVGSLLGPNQDLPEIRTFHSLGLALLSENSGQGWIAAGWSAPPKLLAEHEGSEASAEFWQQRFRTHTQTPPSPAEWTRMLAEWGDPNRLAASTPGELQHVEAWRDWESWKRRLGIAQLHDLISAALLALERDVSLAERWRERAKTLFVDEYQDTDRTQYRLLKILSQGSKRLMAVGDDDQAIYGFRGADLRNILEWRRDLPDGRILSLTGNHRSLSPILNASNQIFPDKPEIFRKLLVARRKDGGGQNPIWYRARDPREETDWIRSRLVHELTLGHKPSQLCVLFRSNREESVLRKALAGLPLASSESDAGIRMLTIHAAKGLEWNVVVVFAQDRPLSEGSELTNFVNDEERRLFYVACTRARDSLYITSSHTRKNGRKKVPQIPHPWMILVTPHCKIRPTWPLRILRLLWEPAAKRARQGG